MNRPIFLVFASLLTMISRCYAMPVEVKTGFFIDAPVTGLHYQTSSNLSGTTQQGAFYYRPGDVVRFFLGGDESGYLISTLSGQEVITPTLTTTTPSRSINLTRLLLSLDSTPNNRNEIVLASQMLSDKTFQQQLKNIDLNMLEQSAAQLNLTLVSLKEAVMHLNLSQQYIEQHFTSDEIIYRPLNRHLSQVFIQKRDWQGRLCIYDLKAKANPKYRPPFTTIEYSVSESHLTEYPSMGDTFRGCYLAPSYSSSSTQMPNADFIGWEGLIGCAVTGCTRNDLNGFRIENYDDEGDWKYRSMAMNFDPETELFMEKTQGLGKNKQVKHANKSESISFTYEKKRGSNIPFEGIWQQTQYQGSEVQQSCLLIKDEKVLQLERNNSNDCPENETLYTLDVTPNYRDMWWIDNQQKRVALEQMNLLVRWRKTGKPPQYTAWEYLPAGEQWDQGILYRYRQTKHRQANGTEVMNTFMISEFKKISGKEPS